MASPNTRCTESRRSDKALSANHTAAGHAKTISLNPGVFTMGSSQYHAKMTAAPDAPKAHSAGSIHEGANAKGWADVSRIFKESEVPLPAPWQEIFGPLRRGQVDDLMVVAQCGQSIDARIATAGGDSHYINGPDGLAHLHRLRALVDAVVVGVNTAHADDPQLTVRRVAGANPARVVIDPNGRLPAGARLLADDGIRRYVLTQDETRIELPPGIEIVRLPASNGQLDPATILAALATRGFRRILIEGGADTVSRFLAAGRLDRLHIVIAPLIIGAGPSSIALPPIARVSEALRVPIRCHRLGDEVLLDCDLSAQRIGVGSAKKSR
jgi:diaminohydroxyphosphoribosylaminopyrimidine deaminase / 5-amino-6-(5-phosphoribosylamino)uracil reductase